MDNNLVMADSLIILLRNAKGLTKQKTELEIFLHEKRIYKEVITEHI